MYSILRPGSYTHSNTVHAFSLELNVVQTTTVGSFFSVTLFLQYLGQVCWTESQTLEAQTTVLRSMMSSIQRLSPLSANSPFVQQKKAGMFQERAKLPIVLFCQYLNDSWKSGKSS